MSFTHSAKVTQLYRHIGLLEAELAALESTVVDLRRSKRQLQAENASLTHRLESAIRTRDIWTKDASHVDRLSNRVPAEGSEPSAQEKPE